MSHLDRAGHPASHYPFFLAARLARYQHRHAQSNDQLTALLGSAPDTLTHLRLCRLPATTHELTQIAQRFHLDQATLTAILSDSPEEMP